MAEQAGAGGTPAPTNQTGNGGTPAPETPASFEAWLLTQDETVRGLYENHTKGLKSALDSERTQRGELAKQLKEAAGKAEKGSELEKALNDATARAEMAERQAAFYVDASKPEIGCSNARAAFAIAQADGLFDRRGNPDWAAIKAAAPELFGHRVAAGNAGAGTNKPADPARSMNAYIRRAAGRGE